MSDGVKTAIGSANAIRDGETALDESRNTIQNLRLDPTLKKLSGKS